MPKANVIIPTYNRTPVYSIVIPTLNEEANIRRCLDSVLVAIVDLDAEIIVVDSCSTDDTVAIAAEYPVRILQLGEDWPKSYAAGVYIGIRAARGRYCQLLDADMTLVNGWLEYGAAYLERHKHKAVAAVGGSWRQERTASGSVNAYQRVLARGTQREGTAGGGPLLFVTEIVQRLNYNPFICGADDRDLTLRLRHAGYRLNRVAQLMLVHYDHPLTTMQHLSKVRQRSGRGAGQGFRYALSNRGLLVEYLREYWGRLVVLTTYGLLFLSAFLVLIWTSVIPQIGLAVALSLIAFMWIVRVARTGSPGFANVSAVRDVFWCVGFIRVLLDRPIDPATYPTDVTVIQ